MRDLDPEARSILSAGRAGDAPTAADRARVKRALMRSIAAGGAGGATSAPASSAAKGAAGKTISLGLSGKLIGAAVLVGALGAGLAIARSRGGSPALPPTAASAGPNGAATVEEAPVSEAPGDVPPSEALPFAKDAPAPPENAQRRDEAAAPVAKNRPQKAAKSAPAPSSTSAEDPLVIETRRLREANGAMQSGDPERALALLDEPSLGNELRAERAAARALALCKLGKLDEGTAAAAAFLRDNPRSPLADRVRAGCATKPNH